MTLACPQCKSPVASEAQHYCYRCGNDLRAYYESLKAEAEPAQDSHASDDAPAAAPPVESRLPEADVETITIEQLATTVDSAAPDEQTAKLRIILPSGDVFDRQITRSETQLGKGPRNDIVIADPAVSTAHAVIRAGAAGFTVSDLGSRNGTYVNGDRISEPRLLNHGDVVGVGLSKLTFRMGKHSETREIDLPDLLSAGEPPPLTEDALADAVINAGLASGEMIERLRVPGAKGRRLYRAIVEQRVAGEEDLRDLMSRTFKIETIDLRAFNVDEAVVSRCPARLLREVQVLPVALEDDDSSKQGKRVILAVADPTDTAAVEKVSRQIKAAAAVRLATAAEITEQIERRFGPRLIGVLPSGEKLEHPITVKEIEIGKAPHNHIVLTDPTVSNTHAVVLMRDGGFSIVDLGSRNGTFVDGERLGTRGRTLRHGDAIQLGQTVLTFRNPDETAANVTAVLSIEAAEEARRRADISEHPAGDSTPAPHKTPEPEPESVTLLSSDAAAEHHDGDDKGEKKKKKKDKKKKGAGERMRAAYISGLSRILAQVLGVILAVMLALYVNHKMSSSPSTDKPVNVSDKGNIKSKLDRPGAGTKFDGGPFEASGVVQVPGTNAILLVDDNRPGEVLWMELDESGRQAGPVTPIALGVSVEDPEGITYDDPFFYVVGSQSNPKADERNALVRFSINPADRSLNRVEVLPDLRRFLLQNVPELRGDGEKKGEDGGLNIEGIAADPDPAHRRLLLGLRSPLVSGQAIVVPIRLRDPHGPFTADNLQVAGPGAIQLPLEGSGIRDLQYDSRLKSFLILAGAPEHHEKTDFFLWEWAGGDSKPVKETTLDPKMKPEGITRASINSGEFIFIVGDAGSYLKLDYSKPE
ncbi:MAG TPA: DUF3616 domain-containing protein [Blastocatellia bacterium]|nr:DUF3616 domain-containing protein [Blastocatellia bacterium]